MSRIHCLLVGPLLLIHVSALLAGGEPSASEAESIQKLSLIHI